MKKLFIAALFATVAVGGAFASGPYTDSNGATVFCEITPTEKLCSATVLYEYHTQTEIDPASVEGLYKTYL